MGIIVAQFANSHGSAGKQTKRDPRSLFAFPYVASLRFSLRLHREGNLCHTMMNRDKYMRGGTIGARAPGKRRGKRNERLFVLTIRKTSKLQKFIHGE